MPVPFHMCREEPSFLHLQHKQAVDMRKHLVSTSAPPEKEENIDRITTLKSSNYRHYPRPEEQFPRSDRQLICYRLKSCKIIHIPACERERRLLCKDLGQGEGASAMIQLPASVSRSLGWPLSERSLILTFFNHTPRSCQSPRAHARCNICMHMCLHLRI